MAVDTQICPAGPDFRQAAIRASLMCTCVNRAASHGADSQIATATKPPRTISLVHLVRLRLGGEGGTSLSAEAPSTTDAPAFMSSILTTAQILQSGVIRFRTFVAIRKSCREIPSRISARLAAEVSSILTMRGHAAFFWHKWSSRIQIYSATVEEV
mgnify:CR=1 FL=1